MTICKLSRVAKTCCLNCWRYVSAMLIGYARVSSNDQDTAAQVAARRLLAIDTLLTVRVDRGVRGHAHLASSRRTVVLSDLDEIVTVFERQLDLHRIARVKKHTSGNSVENRDSDQASFLAQIGICRKSSGLVALAARRCPSALCPLPTLNDRREANHLVCW
jgi:hypothetical protein